MSYSHCIYFLFSLVSTWFANARRRLKKENKMTWSPRNRAEDGSDDGDDKVDDDDADDVSIGKIEQYITWQHHQVPTAKQDVNQ